MAALPATAPPDPTLVAMNSAIEAVARTERPRPYLGMSSIGHDCERFLWGSFRWCMPSGGGFDAKALRNFEDGHRSEDLMAARLRMVPGVKLHTIDPSSGQQFGFSGVGGHFRGHIDGAIVGILQAPKTWHVWEHKSSEKVGALEKLKAAGEKTALAAWSSTYYAQAVLYMHYGNLTRHYLTCTAPGGRMPETSVRTDANPEDAARFIAKAERIIYSPEPPSRISEDPAHWKCKGCGLFAQCHSTALPAPSCRTCLHATPEPDGDGRWSCARHGCDVTTEQQQAAGEQCGDHRYIPALLARWGEAVDASEQEGWVEYRAADGFVFRNGPWGLNSFTSRELAAASPELLRNAEFQAIRARVEGTIVQGEKEAA